MKIGRQSYLFNNVYLKNTTTIIGPNEKESIVSSYVDYKSDDIYFEKKSFEEAEIEIQEKLINLMKEKELICEFDIDLLINGDLNNQETISTYAMKKFEIPTFSIFGACSNYTLSILVGSIMLENSNMKNIMTLTSSHNLTAERTFRNPVEYGGFKEDTLTFTVTGGSCCLLSNKKAEIKITKATMGMITDVQNTNTLDMGSAMAPAAIETLISHFEDFKLTPLEYDLILTGDLSRIGKSIVRDFLIEKYHYAKNYDDCGSIIYDGNNNQTFQGGSGCACCGVVISSYIYSKIISKELKKVLVVATGALMNNTMNLQKQTIPAVAHAIVLERVE